VRYTLVPRSFRIQTGGVENSLPTGTIVRIRFQGAADNGIGQPDENNPLVPWTGDISDFNSLLAGELQFFRFEVEFELNQTGGPVSPDTQPIQLDFLRIPFVF
jgi:inorganic pyrophosphatase